MKYTYLTATGPIKIDVNEQWIEMLSELDRLDTNNTKKHYRHSCSLEHMGFEGSAFAVTDEELEKITADETLEECLPEAIKRLPKGQQEIIKAIYYEQVTQENYAKKIGINQSSVSRRLSTAKKNLKKFLTETA